MLKVDRETLFQITKEVTANPRFSSDTLARLVKENPIAADLYARMVSMSYSIYPTLKPVQQMQILLASIVETHRLLEIQAEKERSIHYLRLMTPSLN